MSALELEAGRRPWKPSARASELIATLWQAFYDGDRAVRFRSLGTASMTGVSLVSNGLAEWLDLDVERGYGRRIRLAGAYLEENGIAGRDWRTEVEGLLAMALDDDEHELAAEYESYLRRGNG